MNTFSQKLRLIYVKLFNEEIDKFTEALLDHTKFKRDKFDLGSDSENRKQFFLNRKTVLRRWLKQGTTCTPDFQKSFNNYKLTHLELKGITLFTLNDFQNNANLEFFNERIEQYLKKQKHVYVKTKYQYIYRYDNLSQDILCYKIIEWTKGEKAQTLIKIQKDKKVYTGTFSLSDDNNIFINFIIDETPCYLLFHESNDRSVSYLVGVSMGYSTKDNLVPRSQKVIFSKEQLNIEALNLNFILNETEVLSAVENRLNLQNKVLEGQVNHFVTHAHKLNKFFNFFKVLAQKQYRQRFYYRLVFREFYAIKKLFYKISKEESYYIFNYPQAFLELLDTVEEIQDISLQIVMQLNEDTLFAQSNKQSLAIKKKFLHLYQSANIKITIIFVVEKNVPIDDNNTYLLNKMRQNHIEVRLIDKTLIMNTVDSLDFSFIHLNDVRDFVLADPIRDSKDVYKLFIDELTMDEYRTDYQRFLEKSKVYNAED